MSNSNNVSPAAKILIERNSKLLADNGMTLDDFAGLAIEKVREIIGELKSVMGVGDDTTPETDKPPVSNQGNNGEIVETEFMGIPVEKRTYGEGRDRRVYQNAKAFEGAAYMNISLPFGDSKLKLAGINLQDLSEATPADNGTRRGRAMLLRLLQKHGLNACGKIQFTVELNVSELMEHRTEELDQAIAAFFESADTK